MKLQKLALTALALSMTTAFAAGNKDKQAEATSANQAPMAQSASANQPSASTANQAAGTNQSASTASTDQAAGTNGSQSGMSSSQGATAQADPEVRQVQQALKDKGHDPGQVDGIMGPRTKEALQSFQQAQGITGAGELDQQTLAALGVQGDSLASTTSGSQPSSSSSMSSANQASPSSASQASSANQASPSANQSSSSTNQPTKQ